jgi:hypothetical protein
LEIDKSEIKQKSVDEIISYFKEKIDEHSVAAFIAVFDHYAHTKGIDEHSINPDIKDVKNIIFCFGKEIPVSTVAAVRPRSIGVVELEDKFVINFMEAPNPTTTTTIQEWIESLRD